jgi:allophanate hydrolase
MDRFSHAAANVAIGNAADATAIEVSLGGATLEVESGTITVAVTGADFEVEHDGASVSPWTAFTVRVGQRLRIGAGRSGSWAYLALAGEIEAIRWLDHTATHSQSGLGGGALVPGSDVSVADSSVRIDGDIERRVDHGLDEPVRVVLGPQSRHFDEASLHAMTTSEYRVSAAVDRMGARLDGPALVSHRSLSLPSEPVVRGSIQVAGDGVPTVLAADHQTTGGYPKIATVIGPDLDRVAQRRPGDPVRFVAVDPAEAIQVARTYALSHDEALRAAAHVRPTLDHRLASENLIGHVQDS